MGIYLKNSGSSENEELTNQELGRIAAVDLESQQQEYGLCPSGYYLPHPLCLPCAITQKSDCRRRDLIGPSWVMCPPLQAVHGTGVVVESYSWQLSAGHLEWGRGSFSKWKGRKAEGRCRKEMITWHHHHNREHLGGGAQQVFPSKFCAIAGKWTGHVINKKYQFSSVQFSHSVVSDSLRPHGLQHNRPPCPSPTPGAGSNSCSLSRWCHPAISSSVVSFSSCPQSLPASESFPMSQLSASGGQSTGVSASASVLPMNT